MSSPFFARGPNGGPGVSPDEINGPMSVLGREIPEAGGGLLLPHPRRRLPQIPLSPGGRSGPGPSKTPFSKHFRLRGGPLAAGARGKKGRQNPLPARGPLGKCGGPRGHGGSFRAPAPGPRPRVFFGFDGAPGPRPFPPRSALFHPPGRAKGPFSPDAPLRDRFGGTGPRRAPKFSLVRAPPSRGLKGKTPPRFSRVAMVFALSIFPFGISAHLFFGVARG